MNKNTGDGELDKLLDNVSLNSARGYTKVGLKAAIKKYAAQEANKAVTEALSRVEAWHGGDLGYRLSETESISLDDRIAQLTKEKESSDE